MLQFDSRDTEMIAGGTSAWSWLLYTASPSTGLFRAIAAGKVDYAGVTESQGTYYNTVGA